MVHDMKINWHVRFQNKAFLAAFAALVVTFAYDIATIFEIVPAVNQDVLMSLINTVLTLLVGLGVIVDPTTSGVDDSRLAMTYEQPKKDA